MDELQGKNLSWERRRFYAALGFFLVWVFALGAMAVLSGRRPVANPAAIERR